MDSITQAALGAAIGEAMLGKKIGKKGAILGAIIATIPDLDVVLLPFFSSLQRISIHRGFSHSIMFSFLGAFLIAILLSRIKWTTKIAKSKLFVFTWLVLVTHMLLDAFTTYGTQLLLPFSNRRVSFDSINIVDPVYTVPLLIGLVLSLFFYRNKSYRSAFNYGGIIISTIYLLGTLGAKSHIERKFTEEAKKQNITYKDMLTVPVGVGSINWYGVLKTENDLYIGKTTSFRNHPIQFEDFSINDDLLEGIDSNLIATLKWFSKDFYTVAASDNNIRIYNMQCDMQGIRYFGAYKAPTAWYFEIRKLLDGSYELNTGMHKKNQKQEEL